MTRFFIYLFPAMIDLVLGAVFFISTVQIAESGEKPIMSTVILSLCAVFYMVFSQVAGLIVKPANAGNVIFSACLLIMGSSLAYIVFPSINALYVLVCCVSIGSAFFFAPFQVFMKTVESDRPRGLSYSVGMYTLAWSTGMGLGPFISGVIKQFGNWNICYIINAVVALITGIGILCLKHHAKLSVSNDEVEEHQDFVDYSKFPDLAWLGWLASGIGCLAVNVIRSYFATTGKLQGMAEVSQGTVLAVLSITQGIVGLLLCRSRFWMYRPLPILSFGIFGVVGLLFFSFGTTALFFYIGAACFGIYSGAFFFYLVFHSLVHPERSGRYVAINESVVGGTTIVGALMAGYLADAVSTSFPYTGSMLLVGLVVVIQAILQGTLFSVSRMLKKQHQEPLSNSISRS
jgi:MFS family permease